MPAPLIPLALVTGAAVRALGAREAGLDAAEGVERDGEARRSSSQGRRSAESEAQGSGSGSGGHPARRRGSAPRTVLLHHPEFHASGTSSDEGDSGPSMARRAMGPQGELAALPAASSPTAPQDHVAGRPSTRPTSHHWERFHNLFHPSFLHHQNSTAAAQDSDADGAFPRSTTWTSDALSSDQETRRPDRASFRSGRHPTKAGRGAGASKQPAISFQREVSLGGRLLHPTVPSILRNRTGPASSAIDPNVAPTTDELSTSTRKRASPNARPSLALRRTATADSEMSFGYSDTDGETVAGTDYSAEDGEDVADRILGRDRREMPALRGRGRGGGGGRSASAIGEAPTRSFSSLSLGGGGGLPLRGWARRKQEREADDDRDVEEGVDSATIAGDQDGAGGKDGEGNDEDDAESDDEEVKHQTYRKTPIISGIMAPFSIMLEVPGFTSSWYLSTGRDSGPVVYAKNPVILDVGLAFSMAFAVFANISIILRFLEVLRPRKSTLIAIMLLTLHDAINISALAVFGKIHAVNDGFTYSEGYWMTMASTLASTIVNVTLIADYVNTKEFKNAGSGLTRKQRELVIMCMLVLFYLSIGALIYALLLGINFETALYFIACTLFTIGFGDITPSTTASRIVLFIYAPAGIVLIALVIATTRETILEQFEQSYKKRREAVKTRYLERQEAKKVNRQLRRAVRLRQVIVGRGGARQWLAENGQVLPNVDLAIPLHLTGDEKAVQEKKDSRLEKALDMFHAFIETGFSRGWKADVERTPGAPQIDDEKNKLPKGGKLRRPFATPGIKSGIVMSAGALVAPARAGTAFLRPRTSEGGSGEEPEKAVAGADGSLTGSNEVKDEDGDGPDGHAATRQEGDGDEDEMVMMEKSLRQHREDLEQHWEEFKKEVAQQERNEFVAKMVVSGSLFLLFWLMGAGVFVATESWNFFEGLYFGFVFFSTIGYGDFSPKTPSGRAFFIVWALFGVGILTVIFSVLGDAWGTIYKNTLSDTSRKGRWRWRLARRRQKRAERKRQQKLKEDAAARERSGAEGHDGAMGSAPVDESTGISPSDRGGSPDRSRPELEPDLDSPQKHEQSRSVAPSDAGDGTDDGGPGVQDGPDDQTGADVDNSTGQPDTPAKKRIAAPEQIPLQLARAAMHLHSEASHLFESQRHVLAEAVTSAPFLHRRLRKLLHVIAAGGKLPRGAVSSVVAAMGLTGNEAIEGGDEDALGAPAGTGNDADEVHRRELERLEACAVAALERQGDSAGVAAVRQLFALVHYDDHLSTLIESSHVLRDTLLSQDRELAELRARVVSLEAEKTELPTITSTEAGESGERQAE